MKTVYLIFVFLILSNYLAATIINVPDDQPTIQDGYAAAAINDTVLVQPGIYNEAPVIGKNLVIGSLFLTTADTSYISSTIVDLPGATPIVFSPGRDSTCILIGFTITGGNSTAYGGGIRCVGTSPTISHNIIRDNTVSSGSVCFGGGIFLESGSSARILNNQILNNTATYDTSDEFGGGLYCFDSYPIINNNTFCYNEGENGIAALYYISTDTIYNNIFFGNIGNYILPGSVYLEHCDIYGNSGDIFAWAPAPGTGELTTVNSNGDSCDVYYNILMDPLFADTLNMDFHLTVDSPCIDAGDPAFPFDPDGTIADMGALYFDQTTALDPPQNITVEISDSEVTLSWDAVTGANSYKVYSSDSPYSGFVEDTSGSFDGEIWSALIINEKKFYYVVASTETIRSKDSNSDKLRNRKRN